MVQYILENPNFAYYDNIESIKQEKAFTKCEIISIPAKYDIKPMTFAFQKNSPYLPLFDFFMLQMEENGINDQILMKYKSPPQFCPDRSGLPVDMYSFFTLFLILAAGIALSLILLPLEYCVTKMFKVDISRFYERIAKSGWGKGKGEGG